MNWKENDFIISNSIINDLGGKQTGRGCLIPNFYFDPLSSPRGSQQPAHPSNEFKEVLILSYDDIEILETAAAGEKEPENQEAVVLSLGEAPDLCNVTF